MMWLRLLVAAAVLLMASSSAFAWLLGKAAHVLAETTNTAESYSPADGTDTIIPRGGKTPGRLNSSSQQMRPRRPDCESAAHGNGGAIATRGISGGSGWVNRGADVTDDLIDYKSIEGGFQGRKRAETRLGLGFGGQTAGKASEPWYAS